MQGLLRSPQFFPVYLCASVGPRGATHRSACPVLRHSESGPLGLSVHKCGAAGSVVVTLPAPFVPHSASLGPATECESSPPRCPSPPLLPVWMYVYFLSTWCWTPLPFDFLSVLVVRGGAVCLPTPPSWFSMSLLLKSIFQSRSIQTSKIQLKDCLWGGTNSYFSLTRGLTIVSLETYKKFGDAYFLPCLDKLKEYRVSFRYFFH